MYRRYRDTIILRILEINFVFFNFLQPVNQILLHATCSNILQPVNKKTVNSVTHYYYF